MKHFNHFLNEKFEIPEKDLDDLLMKTFSIVNDDIKNKLKYEKEKEQGNIHLDILTLLQNEWNERKVEPEFVFRVTDKIFKIHSNEKVIPPQSSNPNGLRKL